MYNVHVIIHVHVYVHVYVAEKSVTWKLILLIKCCLKHSLISCSVQELGIYNSIILPGHPHVHVYWLNSCPVQKVAR